MKNHMFKTLLAATLFLTTLPSFAIDMNANPEVKDYINKVSKQHNLNQNELNKWFGQIDFNESIINQMKKPGEAKPWADYRNIFVQPARIQKGETYWKKHVKDLNAAEKQYGVPVQIIIGILGVETYYGQIKGNSGVLEALATIAFKYPSRSKYFTAELTAFLLLSRDQGWNPLTIKGSYAGAMGLPQFMPTSYRNYAVDGSNNGHINLFDDDKDVIASVANYLEKKGWHRGEPTVVRAKVSADHKKFKESDMNGKLNFTLKQLTDAGFTPVVKVPQNLKVGLMAFDTPHGKQYWITFHNFQVIKRYNNNNKYALVVDILGELVKEKMNGQQRVAARP